jgi:hypothetical protein
MSVKPKSSEEHVEQPKCGIVMPIATTDGCDPQHWLEVLDIIKGCCRTAGFTGDLVSDAADSGTILRRIVGNLYNSDMVIADVSGKNPNVMFELGMRLAFDKPAVVIKDDSTGYSFDTGVIEHISYPRDLHYPSMLVFQEKLTAKLTATFQASKDPQYTTFLKHFGEYTARHIEHTEISSNDLIFRTLDDIRGEIEGVRHQLARTETRNVYPVRESIKDKRNSPVILSDSRLAERILPYVEVFRENSGHSSLESDKVRIDLTNFLDSKIPEFRNAAQVDRKSALELALLYATL